MSTVAPHPPAPPVSPALLDSERYIDDHIRRTRRALKLVDFSAGVITLAIGLLAFLLAAGLIDHWVVPGGLGASGRMALFGLLVLGVAWYGWRQFVPLLRSINPVYAAHTIEKSAPSLKNSLLNALLFRTRRQHMSARVYHALEQQAALRLSTAPTDGAIDRAALLRLGYALLAVVAACALYGVLSPKNLAVSAARVVAPWANIAAPSRVQIRDIKPGDASVARGERAAISAEVFGAEDDEPVRLRYSTSDEQLVDESVLMTQPQAGVGGRFSAELPRASDSGRAAGVQQDLEYWIEAGDARSQRFKLSVYQRPTIVVQRVRYEFPAYTGDPSRVVDNIGDVSGLEGTTVTIEALANQAIKSAYLDFDADGTSDSKLSVDGVRATASFVLQLRPDRRTPWHTSYVLRYTTTAGRTNSEPAQYRIEVAPDYAPEVRITAPEEPELTVRRDETVLIRVEARDPDYALRQVRLVGRVGDRDVALGELLTRDHAGRFAGAKPFVPGDAQLKAGDVLEYWAEARDNRRPDANIGVSEHRRLRIVDPEAPGDQAQDDRDPDGAPPSEGAGGGADSQPGDEGDAEQQPGEGGADSPAGEGEGQPGAGAPGSGESDSEAAEGGEGQAASAAGESGDQPGEAGAEGGQGADGGENADPSSDQSEGGSDQPSPAGDEQPGGEAGDGGSAGGPPPERVSADGDDDPTAFERINEHFAEQDAAKGSPEGGAEATDADPQAGAEDAVSRDAAAEREGATSPSDPSDPGAPEGGELADGQPGEGEAPTEGAPGETASGASSDGEPAGDAANPEGEGEGETPAGADGANNPNNGAAGDESGGEPGAPEASNKKPGDDSDQADEGESGAEGEPPTGDSQGETESDTPGDLGGDRAGAGQRGGGQQADNPGEGEAGTHEPADTGGGAAGEPGAGETGDEAGDDQLAEGETGASSGDQPGAGSETGEADGEQTPQGADEPSGEPTGDPSQGAPSGDAPGETGESETDSAAGDPAPGGGQPGASAGDPASPEAESDDAPPADEPLPGESTGGSSGASPQGGGSNGGGVDGTTGGGEPGGDDANLEYARQQTDLVLERLDEQLAREQVDQDLLRRLGWTEAELRQFVSRWQALKARADGGGEDAAEAQQQLDAALRSLGLRRQGPLRFEAGAAADDLRDLNEAYRTRPPAEYMDRVRWYMKGASAAEDE